MSRVATVRVVNPSDPASYMIINESDFVQGQHQLYDSAPVFVEACDDPQIVGAQVPGAAQDDLRVAKGPGGKWYVWRGKQIVSGRLDSEAAAVEAMRRMKEPVA